MGLGELANGTYLEEDRGTTVVLAFIRLAGSWGCLTVSSSSLVEAERSLMFDSFGPQPSSSKVAKPASCLI